MEKPPGEEPGGFLLVHYWLRIDTMMQMLRPIVRLLFLCVIVAVVAPFLVSSLWLDVHGIPLSGRINAKDEHIAMREDSWQRVMRITVEYWRPDEARMDFFGVDLPADRFDSLHRGDTLPLRYMPRNDVPPIWAASVLRQLHMLPTVRLAEQTTWSAPLSLVTGLPVGLSVMIAGMVLVLIGWRALRIPGFMWVTVLCVVACAAVAVVHEYPIPTAAPQRDIRQALGTVTALDRIEWLYRDHNSNGLQLDQPIQIVGVEFVPEGRTEPVVAADMIDTDSVSNLAEHGKVLVEYEAASPRVAHIRGARRNFPTKNLRGIVIALVAMAVIGILLLFVGTGLNRLLSGSHRARTR